MTNALFDPITNSEDEMISRAGIPKEHACTYLRAYIMASLCFESQLVVSDSTANWNRAFRTLIDNHEGKGYYNLEYVPSPDFGELIKKGHIMFAARDKLNHDFSAALLDGQEHMKKEDLPSESYTKKIIEISSNTYVHWYNLDKISKMFSSNFMNSITNELNNNIDSSGKLAGTLRLIRNRLSDKETFTYKDVTSIMKEMYNVKDEEYQYIRRILRQSYDYNLPELLGLDYRMSLDGIKPTRNKDWMLKADIDLSIPCDLFCNVYGLSLLPVDHLEYIWKSSEYENFKRQIDGFRAGTVDLNEYVISLERYIRWINKVVSGVYKVRNNHNYQYEKWKLSSLQIGIRQYITEHGSILLAKVLNEAYDWYGYLKEPLVLLKDMLVHKVLPVISNKFSSFPEPPEKIKEAIILQNKAEEDVHSDMETKQEQPI